MFQQYTEKTVQWALQIIQTCKENRQKTSETSDSTT